MEGIAMIDIEAFVKKVSGASSSTEIEGLQANLQHTLSSTSNPLDYVAALLRFLSVTSDQQEVKARLNWYIALVAVTAERAFSPNAIVGEFIMYAHAVATTGAALLSIDNAKAAMSYLIQAISAYDLLVVAGEDYRGAVAGTRVNLASAYFSDGDLPAAIEEYDDALEAYDSLIDAGASQYCPDAARALINLAHALEQSGDLAAAVEALQEAIELFTLSGLTPQSNSDVAMAHTRLGQAFAQLCDVRMQQHDIEGAAQACHSAIKHLDVSQSSGDNKLETAGQSAAARAQLGDLLRLLGRHTEAVNELQMSLDHLDDLCIRNEHAYGFIRAHACTNLGIAFLESRSLQSAISTLQRAVTLWQTRVSEPDRSNEQSSLGLIRSLNNLGESYRLSMGLDKAIASFRHALRILDNRPALDGLHQAALVRARLLLGNTLKDKRDLEAAVSEYESALRHSESLPADSSWKALDLGAWIRRNYGETLRLLGDIKGSTVMLRRARDHYESLGIITQWELLSQAAETRMNYGITLSEAGDSVGAAIELRRAKDDYVRLIANGYARLRSNLALCRANLGNVLLEDEVLEAINEYKQAIRDLEACDCGEGFILDRYAAACLEGLAVAHSKMNLLSEAELMMLAALEKLNKVTASGAVHLMYEVALCQSNVGSIQRRLGRFDDAILSLERASAVIQESSGIGARQRHSYIAFAHTELGMAHKMAGKHQACSAAYCSARQSYRALREMGQFHLVDRELKTLELEVLQHIYSSGQSSDGKDGVSDIIQSLVVLQSQHLGRLIGDSTALKALEHLTGLITTTEYQEATNLLPELRELARAAWPIWLEVARALLTEGRPELLRREAMQICMLLNSALSWCVMGRGGQQRGCVIEWLLNTQGLRSQRDLLLNVDDEQLGALNLVIRELDQIDRGMSAGNEGGLNFNIEASTDWAAVEASMDSRLRQRDRLISERDRLRAELAVKGKLPDPAVLNEVRLRGELLSDEQLWFVFPLRQSGDQGVFLVIRLVNVDANGPLQEELLFTPMLASAMHWNAQLSLLDNCMAHGSGGRVRRAEGPTSGKVASDLSREDEADLRESLWRAAHLLLPLLRDAKHQREALHRVHLIPIGDAHALPWANALSDALQDAGVELSLRQYPSVLAWVKAQEFVRQSSEGPSRALRPMVIHDNGERGSTKDEDRELPMAPYEAQWSLELWDRHLGKPLQLPDGHEAAWPPRVDAGSPIDTLIGIGHGGAPSETIDGERRVYWARSGLWMPGWPGFEPTVDIAQRFLSAIHLPGLAHAERLFMSCCVLGRTEDQLGEPLGLMALAFGFRSRVAVGSLLSVSDVCATLISLAFQWSLPQRSSETDWVESFHDLRRTLKTGQWPSGFQDWLRDRLVELVEGLENEKGQSGWVAWLGDLLRFSGWSISLIAADAPASDRQTWLIAARAALEGQGGSPGLPVVQAVDWYVALG